MKLLDLFCCEGVGALGYAKTGLFSDITGIDKEDMSTRYSFSFMQANATGLDYEYLSQYAFIHASPPCQGYSKATPKHARANHERLVATTHLMLVANGAPYVIENVEGSGQELRPNLCLSGVDVGLPMTRRRYFYVSNMVCDEREFKRICKLKFDKIAAPNLSPNGSEYVRKADLERAYAMSEYEHSGIKPITKYGLEQGIPPRMTEAIANIVYGVW